jgi:nucleoside-diphosphate-sugar epimerase
VPPQDEILSLRVALTGATGFIGRHVLRRLIEARHSVRVLMRPPVRLPDDLVGDTRIETVLGGLDDGAILGNLCRDVDAVIHCAGAVRARNKASYFKINSTGTALIADAVARTRARRLVLISSLAAREPGLSAYAASKAAGEAALRAHAGLRDWAIVRPPAVYGPGDPETGRLIRLAAHGVLPVFSSHTARFSLVYVEDLAAGIVDFVGESHFAKQVVEPDDGAEGGYRWTELRDALSIALGRRVRIVRLPHLFSQAALAIYAGGARLLGQVPLAAPDKLRELAHSDWVCAAGNNETAFVRHRRHSLQEGLRKAILAMKWS